MFRSVNELCNTLKNYLSFQSASGGYEWLKNNQNTDNLKDSKPTAFDPRFFDLLVELTDKIQQQKVEMTNQHKEFNQNQEKTEVKN